jgi:MtfA peptidase
VKVRRRLRDRLAAAVGAHAKDNDRPPEANPGARRWLLGGYHHYRRLSPALRERFDRDVAVFLVQKRISGISFELDDVVRLQVAASAVSLSLMWPDYEWRQLTEVLVYADDFGRDYRSDYPEFAGLAHPWGTVLLSAPSLAHSFACPEDGFHVGLHEFAHLLNLDTDGIRSVPGGAIAASAHEWQRLADEETRRLDREDSVLDPYAGDDPAEFFPVAVEAFFERPIALRRSSAVLYSLLATYFGQDPAAWDESLGVTGANYHEPPEGEAARRPRTATRRAR